MLTLHVPDTPETRGLIGATELASLRPGSVLLNASRGTVVDLEALADALRGGHLAGAAVDVFPVEPRAADEEFASPLRGLDNVLLTPHIGGSTVEAQAGIGRDVARKLIMFSDNGTSTGSVNFPEVALPGHPGAHRLLHVHRNEPGILSRINRVFSEGGINVVAQYLQTRGPLGYVVVDCAAASSEAALQELRDIEGTLRCRVLF